MHELLPIALITILAVISPGADFALVTRNSFAYGRQMGLWTALGIAVGVQIHVLYTMVGVGMLIATQPAALSVLKIVGAVYLIYIGCLTFRSTPIPSTHDAQSPNTPSSFQAFKMGLLTNALNPKTTLFVVSTYSQVVEPGTSLWLQFAYGLFMSFAHWLWFTWVSLFFSSPDLRSRMLRHKIHIDRGIGFILTALGVGLAFSSTSH